MRKRHVCRAHCIMNYRHIFFVEKLCVIAHSAISKLNALQVINKSIRKNVTTPGDIVVIRLITVAVIRKWYVYKANKIKYTVYISIFKMYGKALYNIFHKLYELYYYFYLELIKFNVSKFKTIMARKLTAFINFF